MEKSKQWVPNGADETEILLIEVGKFEQVDGMPREEAPRILGGVFEYKGFFCCWAINRFGVRVELTTAFTPEVAQCHVVNYLININQLSYENGLQKAA